VKASPVLTHRQPDNTVPHMETLALKMDRRHAQARGASQAAVVRDWIDRHLGGEKRASLHEQAQDLSGSVAGPGNLSARKLKGHGRN
jgi:hypothetical protein